MCFQPHAGSDQAPEKILTLRNWSKDGRVQARATESTRQEGCLVTKLTLFTGPGIEPLAGLTAVKVSSQLTNSTPKAGLKNSALIPLPLLLSCLHLPLPGLCHCLLCVCRFAAPCFWSCSDPFAVRMIL